MVKIASGEDAWRYFMSTVADDSAARGAAVDYYLGEGTPPGLWFGSGSAALGLTAGETVTATQLSRLLGHGEHPLTGTQLAQKYRVEPSLEERIDAAMAALPASLSAEERDAAFDRIQLSEGAKKARGSVAGFELVFNPPKSVSAWWALADHEVKDRILSAHHEAVQSTIDRLEREAARTRIGTDGVAQVEVQGIVAAGFDHWDTRDGDPQLHTHLLIANRVQGLDGKWRTLDSLHGLSPQIVTLSESYTATLMDNLTTSLGVEWVEQSVLRKPRAYATWLRDRDLQDTQQNRGLFATESVSPKNQKWEIRGVPLTLLDEFSTRSTAIRKAKDELIQEYTETYGHAPSRLTVWKLRAAATRATRSAKHHHSLDELTTNWLGRARAHVGDPRRFADRLTARAHAHLQEISRHSVRADDLSDDDASVIADAALLQLATEKATWSRANARAAIERSIKPHTFRSPVDRETFEGRVLDVVLDRAVAVTPANPLHAPRDFTTSDGVSAFAPLSRQLFTTEALLDAERRLVASTQTANAPRVDEVLVHVGAGLATDQAAAVELVARSGRTVDVIVGPAGAGKTTTLRELKRVWEQEHGKGSVVGLAPSAAAAAVLGESLAIATDNTAMWLTQSELAGSSAHQLRTGQLLIVDEASLAGTLALDRLRAQAEAAGAKLLLVGDHAQLGAVDAGGAFELVADSIGSPAELTSVWRFENEWEAEASKALRVGKVSAIDIYEEHGRITVGDQPDMLADAFAAWKTDTAAGLTSLLIAADNSTVAELNERAQLWRVEKGELDVDDVVTVSGGAIAYRGDHIVTRQNDRRLKTTDGQWVRNGSQWTVDHLYRDGTIRALGADGSTVRLSAAYLREHVQLAYATTAHRSQGRTVDTTHALVDASTSREVLYVAITRGRRSNHLYVAAGEQSSAKDWHDVASHRQVLESIVTNRGAEIAATRAFDAELERTTSVKQLAAEYETIASYSSTERHRSILQALPDGAANRVMESPGWEALSALLRRLEAAGVDLGDIVPAAWDQRPTGDSDDVAAVLHSRLTRVVDVDALRDRLLVGLITPAVTDDTDVRRSLDERAVALQTRAELVLDRDLNSASAWTQELPPQPTGLEQVWRRHATTIAAYRDRYSIDSDEPLGPETTVSRQRAGDRQRAADALRALGVSTSATTTLPSTSPTAPTAADRATQGPRL